jgi:Ca2+-binding EF-hand superfamily protein
MEKLILPNFFVSQFKIKDFQSDIYISGGYAITSLGTMRQKLDYVFAIYDKDKKNSIIRKDMIRVISAMYDLSGKSKSDYTPERCVEDIFALIDVNHDETLTKDEFIEGVLKNPYLSDLISPFNQ